jgi:acyl carrier protein
MTPEALEVKAFIVASLLPPLAALGMDAQAIPDDFDLRTSGVIDSLGFIQLICSLEARFGRSLDLTDVEPEELMNLGVLSSHVAVQPVAVQVSQSSVTAATRAR